MNYRVGSSASVARLALAASLLGSAAVLAAACSSSGGTASPPATVTVTQTPPASTSSPAGTPATSAPAASGPAQCTTAALRVRAGTSQGAAGTIYTNIDFTNVSGSTCVIEGYPGVSLVTAGSNAGNQVGAAALRSGATHVHPITLAAGQTAHAMLGVAQAANFTPSNCNLVTAHWLKVFPPNQFAAAYAPLTTQTCALTSQPTMHITAISAGS